MIASCVRLSGVAAAAGAPGLPAPGQAMTRQKERDAMADLIAIGYPDETTAFAAADEARRLAADLIIQPDAIAVISRDREGSYHVTTSHHPMACGRGIVPTRLSLRDPPSARRATSAITRQSAQRTRTS
jgi:hypothetical protein